MKIVERAAYRAPEYVFAGYAEVAQKLMYPLCSRMLRVVNVPAWSGLRMFCVCSLARFLEICVASELASYSQPSVALFLSVSAFVHSRCE